MLFIELDIYEENVFYSIVVSFLKFLDINVYSILGSRAESEMAGVFVFSQ